MPYHQSHGHQYSSVESIPSTAYSSPRMTANHNNFFDTSSVSSSSRESSVYSGAPASSTNTVRVNPNSRSTRTKRGSDSQGSNAERQSKRPSRSSTNNDRHSGDEFTSWCDTCNSPFSNCSTPKQHERKSKKIGKEKASRDSQAEVLQHFEDLLENNFSLTCLKLQQPGNHKKSGLVYDKQQVIESALVALNMYTRKLVSAVEPEDLEDFNAGVNAVIEKVVTTKGRDQAAALDEVSLLASASASSGAAGGEVCVHVACGLRCDVPIACRKARRAGNYDANMKSIRDVGTVAASLTPVAGTALPTRSARPASPRRRRH